ncbi:MAG: hypothetical protein HC802_01830 [Caldilineaceae bacterium]|nr:hypothetical protein [Caldilineaceae bacterium]
MRRLAAENNINLDEVAEGRPLSSLTKYEVMSAVASRDASEPVVVEPRFKPTAPADRSEEKPTAAPGAANPETRLLRRLSWPAVRS